MSVNNLERLSWWNNLRHEGLLLDAARLSELVPDEPPPLPFYEQDRLHRR